ncbi:MAG: hypothetical protein WBY44_31870 [Bryobacteraceae bacterium]
MTNKTVTTKTKTAKATVVAAPVTPAPAEKPLVDVSKLTMKALKSALKQGTSMKADVAAAYRAELEKREPAKATPAPITPVAIAEPTSKRVTPGAKISEWRIAASQRKGQAGYFLQGGSYELKPNGRNAFTVGSETFFEDKTAAYAALAAKRQTIAA